MISTSKIFRACLLVLGLICGLVISAFAQTYTATVTGTITDPSGAAVQNAKVVAANQGTKLEYTALSNQSGVYTIPFLPVGNYVLNVEAQGFKKLVSNPVTLEVNQTARIDLQLQIGDYTEVVNVEGVAAVLQTESVTVGQVITGNTITSLPLNGRSFQQLTLLVPGAITPNVPGFTSPSPFEGAARPFINGNREQGNQFLLDGVSIDETIDNRIGYKPNIDAIAEFKVETSNSSAEFGNVTGATVIATIKSGTNEFHGSAFEFLRNDALDAQSWANNRNSVPDKPKLRQNIFGGTLGGPILKNQLFFFMDYQGVIQRTGGGGSVRVAPLSWRQGDLSTLSPFIRDPQISGLCEATPAIPTPGVNYQAACFPGSIIPAARIVNPVALSLLPNTTLYPLPNRIDETTGAGILDVVTANSFDGNQFDVKLDSRLSDNDTLSGRYSFGNFDFSGNQGSIPVIMTSKNFSRPQNLALNWTHTFNPSLINEARFGYNRAVFISNTFDWAGIGDANATLGIPGGQAIPGLSSITLGSGGVPLNDIGARATDENNVTNTFQYGDILSMSRGRHFFKMGGQWLRYQQNRFYAGNNGLLGFFSYGTTFTGFNFSDFLLDDLNQKGLGA
ncbi:MAG: carboxypeptidase-like regulatory domain-containing protein, partial [Acidobacteria bacterium]|nr:carboxypeptidase-like regulatory domain-containing protein [Acidobacteriota bacterium]